MKRLEKFMFILFHLFRNIVNFSENNLLLLLSNKSGKVLYQTDSESNKQKLVCKVLYYVVSVNLERGE